MRRRRKVNFNLFCLVTVYWKRLVLMILGQVLFQFLEPEAARFW